MLLLDDEVARVFLEMLGSRLFVFLRLILENYAGTKFVVQTLLFLTKKNLIGFAIENMV